MHPREAHAERCGYSGQLFVLFFARGVPISSTVANACFVKYHVPIRCNCFQLCSTGGFDYTLPKRNTLMCHTPYRCLGMTPPHSVDGGASVCRQRRSGSEQRRGRQEWTTTTRPPPMLPFLKKKKEREEEHLSTPGETNLRRGESIAPIFGRSGQAGRQTGRQPWRVFL